MEQEAVNFKEIRRMQEIAKDLYKLYEDPSINYQISGKIFDDSTSFEISAWDDVKNNEHRLRFMKYNCRNAQVFARFLAALGDAEHTSDWDPYWRITLRNGELRETDSGYWDFDIENDSHLVFDMDGATMRIAIVGIRELVLMR